MAGESLTVRSAARFTPDRLNSTSLGPSGRQESAKRSGIVPNCPSAHLTLCAAKRRKFGACAGGKAWQRANLKALKLSSRDPPVSRCFGTMPRSGIVPNRSSSELTLFSSVQMTPHEDFHREIPGRTAPTGARFVWQSVKFVHYPNHGLWDDATKPMGIGYKSFVLKEQSTMDSAFLM